MVDLADIGDLSSLLDSDETTNGKPLEVSIELIDDFPFNRQDTTEAFKQELTEDIILRGVKEPLVISLHPTAEGRYICKSGHNRKECAKRAGLKVVPVTIDDDYDDYDVIKANLKRHSQSAQSIAAFIDHRLKEGDKKTLIAKKLGKSGAYVSMHVALLNLPNPINEVFASGRCTDVTLISELLKLHKKHDIDVEAWLSDPNQDITRGSVKLLAEFIKHKIDTLVDPIDDIEPSTDSEEEEIENESEKPKKPSDPTIMNKTVIRIEFQGRDGMLLTKIRPTEHGHGYIKFDDDGEEIEVPLKDITITSLIES